MMRFSEFCSFLRRLEETSGKIEKTKILAELFCKTDEIKETVSLSYGYLPEVTGIAESSAIKAMSSAYGFPEDRIREMFYKSGDLGLVAESLSRQRRQASLAAKHFSVSDVYNALTNMPKIEGKGSAEKKISMIKDFLIHMSTDEAKYFMRILLSTMRIGVGDGIVRDALSMCFGVPQEKVERAFNITGDYGEVGRIIKDGKIDDVRIMIFRPLRVMLAEASNSIDEILSRIKDPTAEIKYDGFRCQIHKKGGKVRLFTRNLEDVTDKFPEVADSASRIDGDFILDSEVVGYKDGFLPFQVLSRRIQRKYEIDEMAREIPVRVFVFDVIYRDGDVTSMPLYKRREILKKIIPGEGIIKMAEHVESGFEEFYKEAVSRGLEGIMIKSLSSPYIPGKRVGYWYKLKPDKETLDVVVTAAEHGEGRKGGMYTSFHVAVRSDTGLLEVGKVSSGFSDEELKEMNRMISGLIIDEGEIATVKPEIVIEVMYQEIQRSPHYPSGFALRFPRFVRFRRDKSAREIDTIERVNRLFLKQGRS